MLERRISRRHFIKGAVMTTAVLSGGNLLAACGGAGPVNGPERNLKPPANQDYTDADALIFNGWGFETDMVQRWVSRFNQQNKENASFNVIAGDYPSVMETKLINDAKVDMAYVLDSDFPRWARAQWIYDFEDWWDVDKAKAEMFPNVRNVLTINGKLYGLPYFTSVGGAIATNQKLLDKVGITPEEYPKTWEELYDQMRDIKKSGAAETPWLPRWINEWFGIPISIYEEMANQGLELVDEDGNPIFNGKTEHVRVLEDGKRAWDEGLVPKSVLTMTETDQIDGFSTGQYAMSQQQIYDAIATFNDPQRSQIAGQTYFVPPRGQPWGHLQVGAYVVPNYGQTSELLARDFRLAGYAGYKDNDGDYYVAKQWALSNALIPAYRPVFEDSEVVAAFKEWMPDFQTMMPQLQESMEVVKDLRMTREVWFTEWSAEAGDVLPNVMTGEISPSAALDQLRQKADELVEKYQ